MTIVRVLADELTGGRVELPGISAATLRVRAAVAGEGASVDRIRQAIATEPALAARIMQMANCAALNRIGKPVLDLRSAIARLGSNLVRAAALVFAIAQMRRAAELAPIREQLQTHWHASRDAAAFAYALAKRRSTVKPDTALLAGLLHRIARLYLVARAAEEPQLLAEPALVAAIEREWGDAIAAALVATWGLDASIAHAIRDHLDLRREHRGEPDLTDILTAATVLASLHVYPEQLELNLQSVRAAERLQLNRETVEALLADSTEEIAALRSALGD
ncbi:MAG: HDOD domain-containing protein [Steroidobacteraceae bacterium]|nr:HDOD domain-containing protein [Steroidobacteraceae bacterium]MDW8257994.1 HDOD domain-containing protein [Gammaproteobacteria bacterium]